MLRRHAGQRGPASRTTRKTPTFGPYKARDINSDTDKHVYFTGNTVSDKGGFALHVSADTNGARFANHVRANKGEAGNGAINHSCAANVTISGNIGSP